MRWVTGSLPGRSTVTTSPTATSPAGTSRTTASEPVDAGPHRTGLEHDEGDVEKERRECQEDADGSRRRCNVEDPFADPRGVPAHGSEVPVTVHLTTEAAADCRALAALASMVTWKHNHTGAAWLPVITNGPVPAVVSGTGAADVPATKTGVPVVKSATAQVGADLATTRYFRAAVRSAATVGTPPPR